MADRTFQVGVFNPIETIITAMMDAKKMTDLFDSTQAIPASEYLRVMDTAHETALTVLHMAFSSLVGQHPDRISSDDLRAFVDAKRAELATETEDEQEARTQKVLNRVIQMIDIPYDLDDPNMPQEVRDLLDRMGRGEGYQVADQVEETLAERAADNTSEEVKAKAKEAEDEFFRSLGIENPRLGETDV